MFFGVDEGRCNDFSSEKYRYIVPMQGDFENPLVDADIDENKDTFILYWIEREESLTQDDYITIDGIGYDRQKCVADILVRFVGKEAEDWVKAFRHLTKRKGISEIWNGVCNGYKLEYTSPVRTQRVYYFGKNSQVAFDVRFKMYYDECIATGWKPLTGIDFTIEGNIHVEDNSKSMEENHES